MCEADLNDALWEPNSFPVFLLWDDVFSFLYHWFLLGVFEHLGLLLTPELHLPGDAAGGVCGGDSEGAACLPPVSETWEEFDYSCGLGPAQLVRALGNGLGRGALALSVTLLLLLTVVTNRNPSSLSMFLSLNVLAILKK